MADLESSGKQHGDAAVTATTEADLVPIPGTVHLVDLEGTIRAAHASCAGQQDVVLVPAPSADPDDPLNWTPRRKWMATVANGVYNLTIGISSAAVYSVLEPISRDTGLTVAQLNAGTGYMFLMFGWGCLFWQAVALQYGKRPVYLFSLLATVAIMVWVPHATTNGAWIGSKMLQGFVGAPIESLCEISVTDVYFAHERGTYMGIYAFILAGGNYLSPVLAGFINDGQGWEWVMYWCAIWLAMGFVFCFFFLEETNFDRGHDSSIAPPSPPAAHSPGTSTPHTSEDAGHHDADGGSDPEKMPSPIEKAAPAADDVGEGVVVHHQRQYKMKSYYQRLSLRDKPRPFHLWTMMYRPLLFFSLPAVSYAGFSYGSNLVWFNVLNGTASPILGGAPYNFPASMVGLSYVSPIIGVAIGSWYSGFLGDKIVLWLARRKKGILEAEYRLWLFSACLIIIPGSLLLWGVGAAHHVHWFGLVFAMGVIACSNSIGIQLSVSYCVDSYKMLSGEAMVTVIIIRNTMSFAVNYGITPWVEGMGYQNAFILAAFAGLAQVCTFFIVVRYGKGWRKASMARYEKYVEQSERMGLVH